MDKLINAFIVILILFGIMGCGDDESCLQEDYFGTWTGVVNCDGEDAETATVVISAGQASNEILVDDGETEYLMTISGCNIDIEKQTIELLGLEIALEGEGELKGDKLIIRQKINFIGIKQDCVIELTR